jgi:hypothetical protein
MTITQPLPQPPDLASQLQLVQSQLADTARKAKAIAFAAVDQAETTNILQLAEDIRRAAAIAGTHVADLQNAATRQQLRSGAALPPDASASASAVQTAGPPPTLATATEEAPHVDPQPTQAIRPGGFLQESPSI